ncbi:MAG TPA: DUF4038 domain-containing protein [Kofleriaceae bacterium]|jgi:hypothetical protein|nr:DUF4038 domain-containing protein [Kofleriaceae bacterium]
MVRSRGTSSRWLAAAIAALTAACSSAPGSGTGDDGGTPPGSDAPPPTGLFPLGASSTGGYLVTADGHPFLLHGEAAWSLIVQLTTADTMQYLADRHRRGVNAILVNLIEGLYSDHPPSNATGDAPFSTQDDFSTPGEAYFAHADQVIDLAAGQGMAVLLFPSYLGKMAQEGWRDQMSAMGATAGAPKCAAYGRYLGQRYAGKHNIVWMWGGDFMPSTGSSLETCMKAISDGILANAPARPAFRTSAHWSMESSSWDEQAFRSSIDAVGVYTYNPALPMCRTARMQTAMPTYLVEGCYENDMYGRCPAISDVRRQQWWSMLGCGAGEIYGVEGIWQFGSTWSQQLGSPVSVGEQQLNAIVQQVAWQTLALDDALVTVGRGTPGMVDEVAAARTADHRQALIYIPPNGSAQITVALSQMSGPVTATWQDPTADHSIAAGDGLTGSHVFTIPSGTNAGGDTDWALVLTAP